MKTLCPCHSQKPYSKCCEPYHKGKLPPTAKALMRSRYSGYALGLVDYIIQTTHPANPSRKKELTQWKKEKIHFCNHTHFINLTILDSHEETTTATVTFYAELETGGNNSSFQEESFFEKVEGKWLYKDGVVKATPSF